MVGLRPKNVSPVNINLFDDGLPLSGAIIRLSSSEIKGEIDEDLIATHGIIVLLLAFYLKFQTKRVLIHGSMSFGRAVKPLEITIYWPNLGCIIYRF